MSDPRPFPSASTSGAYQKSIYEPAWETDFPVRFGVADGAQAFIYHWHDAVEILCGPEREYDGRRGTPVFP